jgi:hypothetical protein
VLTTDFGTRAFFVDGVKAKFGGHEPDATYTNVTGYDSGAWLHERFNLLDPTAIYHPNSAGQQAISDVLRGYGSFGAVRCLVPAVKGRLLASARVQIAAAHCRVGRITYARVRTRRDGVVLAQNPPAGRALPEEARINLLVNRRLLR